MSITMPAPVDAVTSAAYDLLIHLTHALAPLDGGAAAALAIVLCTAVVRLLLVPLARRQVAAQRAQARLAPRLRELQQEHRADPQRLRTEIAALYRGAGTSPFGLVGPALLQAPVFFVLYQVFSRRTLDGRPNALLGADLFGHPLGAHGLAAGWPLLALVIAIAGIATITALRARRAGHPLWTTALPYLTVVAAAFVPLAAGCYLLTTTAWSAVEAVVLRRDEPAAPAPV